MSKQLLDTLENRVHSAVGTIESLRAEINELKEERKTLEDKLQELIERIGKADPGGTEAGGETPMAVVQEESGANPGPAVFPYKDSIPEY